MLVGCKSLYPSLESRHSATPCILKHIKCTSWLLNSADKWLRLALGWLAVFWTFWRRTGLAAHPALLVEEPKAQICLATVVPTFWPLEGWQRALHKLSPGSVQTEPAWVP